MAVEVKVPAVGESVQEAMIHKWYKKSGEYIEKDEILLEVETDKATVTIPADVAGVVETLKKEGDTVAIGEVIAKIDSSAKPSATPAESQTKASESSNKKEDVGSARKSAADQLSPSVRRLTTEHDIDPKNIAGTGKDQRVTKGDVLAHIEKGGPQTPKAPTSPAPQVSAPTASGHSGGQGDRTERREPMSMLRRRIAERLVQAQHTAAILTTFNEIDMSQTMDLRKRYKDIFKEKHGVGLGFMSFFVKATVRALKEFPAINGWIDNNEIVYHNYHDIGVAVSSNRGLVVPVIRNADQMTMAEIEQAILYYSTRARDGKITVEDLSGGTFTVSNGGVFGSLLSTPILNPPQSGILGMHKIEERPVAINGQVVIRPMMYVALSYDHRIVDGKEAVQFLVKIKECIEDPSRLLLEI